jgi:hypothetical protein
LFSKGLFKDSQGRVMMHGGPTELKNQSWRHDIPLFRSGLPITLDFGKTTNDHLEIFQKDLFLKDSHRRVLLHGGDTKLKNQSWSNDASLFWSGLSKTHDFGTITNEHLEIFHEGFGKDSHGHVMKNESLPNPNPVRSYAYKSFCKHLNFWEKTNKD